MFNKENWQEWTLVMIDSAIELADEKIDIFNPSNGQTVFSLSESPSDTGFVKMFVNGVQVYSFNVTGTTVTYTGISFSLATSDLVEFFYS